MYERNECMSIEQNSSSSNIEVVNDYSIDNIFSDDYLETVEFKTIKKLLNEDDTPSYKGVVYNEMKGAMSSVDEVLVQSTLEAMYKDSFYRFNSGGDPDVIPTLTYQAYKDFYHKHYTPQNAMTYFYGKLDIEEKLKFLDEEYFSKYEKSEEEITISPQVPHINLDYCKEYEISSEETIKDNTFFILNNNLQ